jgi:AAA15 family ATPase/GTPase
VADRRTRKLRSNLLEAGSLSVVKSIGLYGANNTGKTCLLRAIEDMKMVLSNIQNIPFSPNIFSASPVTSMGVTFANGKGENGIYHYEFSYNVATREYIYEKFEEISVYPSRNRTARVLFSRDKTTSHFECADKEVEAALKYASYLSPLLYGMNIESSPTLTKYRNECKTFADSLSIIASYNIPLNNTIAILKGNDEKKKKLIVEFVKNADVSLEDFRYDPKRAVSMTVETPINEEILKQIGLEDQFHLVSTYRGKNVPSLAFDSTGTKKIEAYASYIIDAIQNGKTLVVDELEASLNFALTRAMVALFNNLQNEKAQLFFSTQDVALLDCPFLMRKEQIWFAAKEDGNATLFSLKDSTAREGIRETENVYGRYTRGSFKGVPNPQLINSLMDMLKK